MNSRISSHGIIVTALLIVLSGCSMQTAVEPSPGPWDFSGTLFSRDAQQVGPPISGAHLTMASGDEVKATTTSDASGRYAFNKLEAGSFVLTITAPGFVTLTPQVKLDRNMKADFGLFRQ